MADPEYVFFQGLKLFPHIRIYANTINDLTVPYMTAYVDLEDPFLNHSADGLTVDYDEKYFPIIKSFTIPDTPPPKRRAVRLFSWEWFKSYRPPLPPRVQGFAPRVQGRFPFNMVTLALIPILFPAFIGLALLRLYLSSRQSRTRIKLLEADDASATERLVHIFAQLEREVEDIVVDIIDDPTPIRSQESTKMLKKVPRVTPAQRKMAKFLNALPQLKKERAYIADIRNSHATIIARDMQNFEFHKIGEGVLRHWADAFVM
jgi:hypothetical protein